MIVKDVEIMCLIHDRHKGILQAIDDIHNGSTERRRPALWLDLKSRWCMRHMGGKLSYPVQEQNPYEAIQAVMQPESGKEIQLPVEKVG